MFKVDYCFLVYRIIALKIKLSLCTDTIVYNIDILLLFFIVQVQLSLFSPHPGPPPHPSPPPTLEPILFGFVHVSYTCSMMDYPLFSPISLSHLPSGHCQFVLYFSVIGYILLACLFVD